MIKFRKSFILSLAMAVIMCGLEAFDAPAYTRCQHIEVCEFLDVLGIMDDSTDSQMTGRDGESDLFLTHLSSLSDLSSKSGLSLSEMAACFNARKKRRHLDLGGYFSIRYQGQGQGIFTFMETLWIKIAILNPAAYARYAFASKDHKPYSQPLRIVAISVIQS